MLDETVDADEVDGVSNEMPLLLKVDEASVSIVLLLLLPFSLTKYSAIFAEVKESFEIYNNQLGAVKIAELVKNLSKSCSLRN